MVVKGKYTDNIREAIDKFWAERFYPPTIRDLMAMSGCRSTSHVAYIVKEFPDIDVDNGRIIPHWIKDKLRRGTVVCVEWEAQ